MLGVSVLFYGNWPKWVGGVGGPYSGAYPCAAPCIWTTSANVSLLAAAGALAMQAGRSVLAVYNVHTLWEEDAIGYQPFCQIQANYTMAESAESLSRFRAHFNKRLHRLRYFDGVSLTHPSADVQQIYPEAWLNASLFVEVKPFHHLVKAAAYIASDCHSRSVRHSLVASIKAAGFRVDGLGKCHASRVGPEGHRLSKLPKDRYNMAMKRSVVSNYLFVLAFENTLEPGYVTEKVFDALLAGVVPVYYGDSEHCRALMPHPDAAIFFTDFNLNATALVEYLNFLAHNSSAYEAHRQWRHGFSPEYMERNALLRDSHQCKFCKWASERADGRHTKRKRKTNSKLNNCTLATDAQMAGVLKKDNTGYF